MRPIKKKKHARSSKFNAAQALKGSILSALGTLCLPGCWSFEPPPCTSPEAILNKSGEPSGYQTCQEGQTIKTGPAQCAPLTMSMSEESGYDSWSRTPCSVDSDCEASEVCLCEAGSTGYCVSSSCGCNPDCASGECELLMPSSTGLCSGGWDGGPLPVFSCRDLESDECAVNADCGIEASCVRELVGPGEIHHRCESDEFINTSEFFVVCGRPLESLEGTLEATLCSGEGWESEDAEVCADLEELTRLPSATRRALLDRWEAMARLEHSSVASFARVTLELMSLGAPADLLMETQLATRDEVEHAQRALEVVSTLREEPTRFAEFPSASIELRTERDAILVSVIEEACLGETLGVVEARCELNAMRVYQGPRALQTRLSQIIEDESRHATLAWRTFGWLLYGDQPDSAEQARRSTLALETLRRVARRLLAVSEVGMSTNPNPRVGILNASDYREARSLGLKEVVLPSVEALLGPQASRWLSREVEYALSA